MPTESALNQYLDFLRFGSVSTDSKYKDQVLACAEWLQDKLSAIGLDSGATSRRRAIPSSSRAARTRRDARPC